MIGFASSRESGSALIYILIAIALLALLTITFMQPASQQTQTQNSFKLVSDLESQVDFIRSAAQECVANYYQGDATINVNPANTDPGQTIPYPIRPDSAHFSGQTPGPTTTDLVKDLRCPGNPGDNPNEALMFSAASGKFLPPPPELFADWQWYNGEDGVFFWTSTNKTDQFIQTALQKLVAKYALCEADVIDATGGAQPLDSGSTVSCPAGSYCFRVRMIAHTGAVWTGDTYSDTSSCSATP